MMETAFTPLATRCPTMLTVDKVQLAESVSLFQEADNHATKLDWLAIIKIAALRKQELSTTEWRFKRGQTSCGSSEKLVTLNLEMKKWEIVE